MSHQRINKDNFNDIVNDILNSTGKWEQCYSFTSFIEAAMDISYVDALKESDDYEDDFYVYYNVAEVPRQIMFKKIFDEGGVIFNLGFASYSMWSITDARVTELLEYDQNA